MMRRTILISLAPLLLAACGGEGSAGNATSGGGGSGGAPGEEGLAPPAVGMQLKTAKITVPAGGEEYQCWSFKVPAGAPIALTGLENKVPTQGVHHWAVFTRGSPVTDAGPWECATMGIDWGLVSGGGVGTPGVTFPSGTAMTIPAEQHIVFQLHLLNASGSPLEVQPAYINLVGAKDPAGLQPVGLLIAGTLDIAIPAHGTDVTVSGGCMAPEPLANIFAVFPHMHQLGRRITAEVTPSGGAPVMLADQTWDFSDQGLYEVKGSAALGDQVNVTCTYDNPSDTDVSFGLSTKDEMCVNVLYYYPASQPSSYCGIGG